MEYRFRNLIFEGGVKGIAYMEAQQNSHLHSDDWQRTVYVDTLGVKTTEFDLSDQKKKELIQSGRDGVKDYINWFNNASNIAN